MPVIDSHHRLHVAKSLTAKDYIQDGLVAMWDGIENVGFGVHDNNATIWKDLVTGVYDATLTEHGRFDSDCFITDGIGPAATFEADNSTISTMCEEIGIKSIVAPTTNNMRRLAEFSNGSNYKKFIWIINKTTLLFGWLRNYDSAIADITFPSTYTANTTRSGTNGRYVATAFKDGINVTPVQIYNGSWPYGGTFGASGQTSGIGIAAEILFVRRYNRHLTSEEIVHNANIDKARFQLGNVESNSKIYVPTIYYPGENLT